MIPFLIQYVVMIALLLFPLWKIFGKAGLHPALSLITLIPMIGGIVCIIVLAFARWPATEGRSTKG